MTVNNSASTISYNGNGSTDTFTVPFPMVEAKFVQVYVTDVNGSVFHIPSAAYIVTMSPLIGANPTSQGGTIKYPLSGPVLPVGTKITIVRDLPAIQKYSISNQSIVYPPIIEEEFDYLTLLRGGEAHELDRAFKVPVGDPLPRDVPPVAQRAGHGAFFDTSGDLVPGEVPAGGVFISAAMIPVVEAGTLEEARDAMGISTTPQIVTGTYVVTALNDRQVLDLEGNLNTITIPAASGFKDSFWVFLYNRSNRGKRLTIDGFPTFILWPRQFCWVFNSANGWLVTNPGRWRALEPQQFYVDDQVGGDVNDGLAPGNQAFKTIQKAVDTLQELMDGDFTINLADGVHQVGNGVRCNKAVLGSSMYKIRGNVGDPSQVLIIATSGGDCIRVSGTAAIDIQGCHFQTDHGCLLAETGGKITVSNVVFGQGVGTSSYHMIANFNATISVVGPYTIVGDAGVHLGALAGGAIFYNPGTVTIAAGGINFFSAFINVQGVSSVFTTRADNTFVNIGAVHGKQFVVSTNSVVAIEALPDCPGDVAGSVSSGGQFVPVS